MKTTTIVPKYRGYRFPPEIISHTVWLYFRFSLSFRDIEELLAERGIAVTYETIRQWTLKFGQTYANEIKRRCGKMGDTWYLDEVYLKINGKTHDLWRAIDQDDNILDILVQSQRNKLSLELHGNPKAKLLFNLMSMFEVARPNCFPSFVQPQESYEPKGSSLLPTPCCIPGSKNSSRQW